MRRVTRGQAIPEALHDELARKARYELTAFYSLPAIERIRRRPPFVPRVWSSKSIVEALLKVFSSKCAYCETYTKANLPNNVSHYRPTSNAVASPKNNASDSPEHYSWFAYEWKNLLPACDECSRSKRNLFPVKGPRAKFRCSWSEAESSEQALLINPCHSEPKKHLRFWIDGTVIGRDEIGWTTIEVLSLQREELIEARSRKFQRCLHALAGGRTDRNDFEQIREELSERAEFSGAARIAVFELLSEASQVIGLPKPSFRTIVEDAIRAAIGASNEQWEELLRIANSAPARGHLVEHVDLNGFYEAAHPYRQPRSSQLRRVSIRNFKGITKLDLEVPAPQSGETGAPCMMLLGENSTGKSTTLQAIALTLMGEKMRSRLRAPVDDFLQREVSGWQLDDTVTPEVLLEFDTGEPVRLEIDPITKQFIGQAQPSFTLFAFGARRFFGSNVVRRQPASVVQSLFDPFAKLPNPERWLESLDNDKFNAVARAMREVLTLQEDDSIGRDEDGRLFVQAHGRDTPLERLSDGYRSLMAMVLNVMRGMLDEWGDLENACGLVLIDEIETHLHPRWKLRVISALRSAMPNVQFIATTHDPLCLRGMRSGEVQVLVRDDAQQIQALTGLPDVRGLRAEQLLTSDYFGLSSTADPDVEGALHRLALPVSARPFLSDLKDQEALQALRWIGDTPTEQIVNEALRQFIDESNASAGFDRSKVREAAVEAVLEQLRSFRRERRQ